MKKLKKFLFAAFTVAILSCLLCQPAFAAISESDVQAQVDAVGKEAVSGNVFIWFLCAIGFLKVGQKIDSFLSSLGVNVGHTGGSMLAEAMIAARGIGGIKNFSSHHFGGGRNSSSTNVNTNGGKGSGGFGAGFASGGLAGVVSRKVTNSAIKTATTTPGSKPSGLGSLLGDAAAGGIGGHMYASSVSKGGNFANNVIGSVATGSISQMGSISGEKAAEALHSYMGYAALESGAENVPTFQNIEIGGGRITGTELTAEHPEGISFGKFPQPDTMAYRLLSLTAISGEFPTDQLNRLPGSPYYLESVVTALKKDGLLRTYYRDKLRGYRLGPRAKATLLESRPDRFASYLTGDTDTNRLKCEIDRRLRLHRLAETYVTMDNAGVCVYRDEKPAIFAPDGYAGGRIVYPAFFSSREVKEMGIDTTKIRSSRSTGILLAPSGIFVTYNSSSALMKWRYKSEMRVKALIWSVICQQRLSPQFRHEDVHGLILGNSMDLAYQILTSTGGRKHDFFMLDGSYEHFLYLTNDHQGEVILALLCDPGKTAELDRILLQGLTARQPGLAIEHDGISPDGSPVLFGYFCDLPRIARFNTSLELSERPGTLICFDFQAEVLHSYCGSRMRFQTIDFTKFEGRLFP